MDNDNIHYYTYEDENDESVDLSFLLNEFEEDNNVIEDFGSCSAVTFPKDIFGSTFPKGGKGGIISEITNYEINFTNKQLQLILEYYGLSKFKNLKKQDLISHIMVFETEPANREITTKRKMLWYYMNELKRDKVMKRFILNF